ncbi:MAG: hydroxymethylbilane synthase [Myxococcota bacterium]
MSLRLGTRGSKLALAQSEWVARQLRASGCQVERVRISTAGDRIEGPLSSRGGKALWVREIEEALLEGEIDLAVHSAKDLPAELSEGLTVGAYPRREDPRDVFVGSAGLRYASLPAGSRVGTGSLRRVALLRSLRPEVEPVPMRGNVPTRLAKLDAGEVDGLILAAAGLIRLGLDDRILDPLDPDRYLPAGGQGALAIEVRVDDEGVHKTVARLNESSVAAQVRAERAFLFELGVGCHTPIGVHATIHGARLRLRALVLTPDGSDRIEGSAEGDLQTPETLGMSLGRELLERGARRLIEAEG